MCSWVSDYSVSFTEIPVFDTKHMGTDAADFGQYCLQSSLYVDARHKWVNWSCFVLHTFKLIGKKETYRIWFVVPDIYTFLESVVQPYPVLYTRSRII